MSAFYYDIICPYAYMAFMRLHRDNLFVKKNIELKPILLGGLFKLMGQESDPNTRLSALKANYLREDIMRQASLWSVPLSFNERQPLSSLKAMRLVHACEPRAREELSALLYKCYWHDNCDISDDDFIANLSRQFSCHGGLGQAKELLTNATAEALKARVFGVPSISINNRIYFGSDRLALIGDDLGLKALDQEWQKGSCLNFYFDFTSPYSYLAHAEIEKALKAGVVINFKPILLGALFKELGQNNVPMLSAHVHKAAYYLLDMHDWAKAREVAFTFNTHFPLKSVSALRVALVEPKTIAPIFLAAWAQNQNIGRDEVLETVLDQAGFRGADLLAKAQDITVKEQLKAIGSSALASGVFGVPSFSFNNSLVFGQDRFEWLKRELMQK